MGKAGLGVPGGLFFHYGKNRLGRNEEFYVATCIFPKGLS